MKVRKQPSDLQVGEAVIELSTEGAETGILRIEQEDEVTTVKFKDTRTSQLPYRKQPSVSVLWNMENLALGVEARVHFTLGGNTLATPKGGGSSVSKKESASRGRVGK